MAGVNTRVVNRSNALLGYAYGTDFVYSEKLAVKGIIAAWLVSIAMPLISLTLPISPVLLGHIF